MAARTIHDGLAGAVTLTTLAALLTASCGAASRPQSEAIAQVLEPAFRSHRSGGAVLIAKSDQLIFRQAYGLANVALDVPMQVDHVFGTGSITKQFTAVAILQLVENSALRLDDDARR